MNPLNLLVAVSMAQSWATYTSAPCHFSAKFPGKVESQATDQMEAGQKITTTIFIARDNKAKTACILSSTAIPSTMKDAERAKMNDGIVYGFLNSSHFTKVSEKQAKFGENSGRYIKVKKDKALGALWIISTKSTVYTLTAVNPTGDSSETEKLFFSSFKITK